VVILGALGLIITHRVCGPIFVITRHFGTMLDNKYPHFRPLRSGDEFAPMFVLFKQLVDKQRDRDASEIARLGAVLAAAKAKGLDTEALQTLQALVDERAARVAPASTGGAA
jgi:hypothetical protein